jgi:hypothetical protein
VLVSGGAPCLDTSLYFVKFVQIELVLFVQKVAAAPGASRDVNGDLISVNSGEFPY